MENNELERVTASWDGKLLHARVRADGDIVGIFHYLFTCAILADCSCDALDAYGDRWCYHTEAEALAALEAWTDDQSEPEGWHRHPGTGRRRPDGDKTKEYVNP